MSDTNEEVVATPEASEQLEAPESYQGDEQVTLTREEYNKFNETIGSMKRELKDLKKSKETTVPSQKTESKPEAFGLLEKTYLRAAGVTAEDEVELALTTAKKWDMPIDKLVDDEDFQVKLENLRTKKSNELATSNIKGRPGSSQAKFTPEYWIAKGTPPSREDVPDRKTRAQIARAMMKNASTNGKTFYND